MCIDTGGLRANVRPRPVARQVTRLETLLHVPSLYFVPRQERRLSPWRHVSLEACLLGGKRFSASGLPQTPYGFRRSRALVGGGAPWLHAAAQERATKKEKGT